jgi:hypothetical protein
VIQLIIAIAVGVVIAIGGVFVLENALNSAATGTPSSQTIYMYGSR